MRFRLLPLALLLPTLTHAAPEPVIRWDFGAEETSKLVAHGGVHRDIPGPRPPQFPDFDSENDAVQFDGGGAYFAYPVQGPDSPMIFRQGDSITIEAWVNLAQINQGENAYVVGKGRTGAPGFAADNQNWALRVRESGGLAHISFLFATPKAPDDRAKGDAHWHRWTSTAGIASGSGWHRLAVSYRFGSPETITGWLDEKPTDGAWDMGGPTQDPPVSDEDAVWIGSAMRGSASNSFRGLLDSISIFRELVPNAIMRERFRREGGTDAPIPAPAKSTGPVEYPAAPAGRVLVTLHEALPQADRLPKPDEAAPPETLRWMTDDFVISRLPLRYDAWGIRDSWKGPVLLRAVGEIKLPPGEHRFLLRSRGVSRLSINGVPVATLKVRTGGANGYEKIMPVPEPPLPGLRPLGFGDQETFGTATIAADGKCSLVLEAIVGAAKRRSEPGELCVAIELPEKQTLVFAQTAGVEQTPLTDAGWLTRSARSETTLAALDDENRRTLATSQDAFWEKRHTFARDWVAGHQPPALPAANGGVTNPIDRFLAAKAQKALDASKGGLTADGAQFHKEVLPVLRDNCFRCHGEKEKGDLRLNTLEAALKAGTSGNAAVVPGAAAKSELVTRIKSHDSEERMPPKGDGLKPGQIAAIESWISHGAPWPAPPVTAAEVNPAPALADAALLRRLYLDTVGVPPSEAEARAFLADREPAKTDALIDRLLADDRFSESWMGYWQDVLAENPSMLKPSLNNSGPFRFFLHDALRDHKPLDRMITELILLRGSGPDGGSAGFGMAADNDAPLAAKAQVLGSAFLGIELQCARCHDAPFHSSKQHDLYALSAMLRRENVTVPKSSTVPPAFFEKKARESLIKVTLKPGEAIKPEWPLEKVCGFGEGPQVEALMQQPTDSRERLAALLTAPQNQRVPQVLVNRVWKRLVGAGFVEPAHDWEGHAPSHPELLAWLAGDFVAHDWDFRHLIKTILTSRAYQAQPLGSNLTAGPESRFFPAPDRRRLTAEEVVDSLFTATGRRIDVEELTFDPDTRQSSATMNSLGNPKRAWEFASLSNERDRPSLALPRAQAVTDVLEAFGWTGSRQNPRTDRETDPNVLQPGILANSTLTLWLTRAAVGSPLAELALKAKSPEALIESVFLRVLSRLPTEAERTRFAQALTPGFAARLTGASLDSLSPPPARLPRISWTNHLTPESTTIKNEQEKRARAGDVPDPRLEKSWRETYEDFVWAVLNLPEFVWKP